jgi:hypothetical protein
MILLGIALRNAGASGSLTNEERTNSPLPTAVIIENKRVRRLQTGRPPASGSAHSGN